MKKFFFITLICAFTNLVNAQIILKNPSIEGDVCEGSIGSSCHIPDWNPCETWNALLDTGYTFVYPRQPYEGNTYLLLAPIFAANAYYLSSFITQKLDCSLKKSKTYRFKLAASSYFHPDIPPDTAFFLIKGANDSCGVNTTEEMYRSAYLEYNWRKLTITITPKQDDYSYFMIYTYVDTTRSLRTSFPRLLLDDLSPIYPHNGNAVHIQNIQDTTIQPGVCVQLQATSNITTYDTVFWLKKYPVQDGFRTDTIRNTFTLNDCPTTTTTYIIALRDSVPDCAGIWWSYDTVRVAVNAGTDILPISVQENFKAKLYPNPLNTSILNVELPQSGTLEVISVIGQLITKYPVSEGLNEMNLSNISKGNYIVKTTYANGEVDIQKLTITK